MAEVSEAVDGSSSQSFLAEVFLEREVEFVNCIALKFWSAGDKVDE